MSDGTQAVLVVVALMFAALGYAVFAAWTTAFSGYSGWARVYKTLAVALLLVFVAGQVGP